MPAPSMIEFMWLGINPSDAQEVIDHWDVLTDAQKARLGFSPDGKRVNRRTIDDIVAAAPSRAPALRVVKNEPVVE
jgi:hypothetical protein